MSGPRQTPPTWLTSPCWAFCFGSRWTASQSFTHGCLLRRIGFMRDMRAGERWLKSKLLKILSPPTSLWISELSCQWRVWGGSVWFCGVSIGHTFKKTIWTKMPDRILPGVEHIYNLATYLIIRVEKSQIDILGRLGEFQIPRISNVMVSAKPSSQLSAPMYPRIAIMCYNDMLGHHVIKVLHPKHRIISLWVWNWCIIGIMGSSIGPFWRDGLDGNVVLEKSCFPLFWGDAFYHSGVLGPWTTGVWVSTTIPGQVARHHEGPEGQVHRGESDRLHLEAATSPRAAERETEKERAPESSYVRCPC